MKRNIAIAIAFFLAAAVAIAQTAPSTTSQPASPIPTLRVAPPPRPAPEKTLEFPLGEGVGRGDGIFIPVEIGGKDHLFLVDTGAPGSIIDPALAQLLGEILGPPIGKVETMALQGKKIELPLYRPSPLRAAGQLLNNGGRAIATADLEVLRGATGRPVEGIVGCDVLAQYVLRLDFHRRVMQFIDPQNFEVPDDRVTKSFPMIAVGSCPGINLAFAGGPNVPVVIDTGFEGIGTIMQATLQKIPSSEISDTSFDQVVDAAGNAGANEVHIKSKWPIGDTAFENAQLRIAVSDGIGIRALADFIVTMDFAQKRVYLESLHTQHPPERPDLEIGIRLKDGQFFIHDVREKGKSLDVQANDQLLAVDGKDISKTELWRLREQLQKAPAPVLRLKRGDQTHEVTLHHDQPAPATAPAP